MKLSNGKAAAVLYSVKTSGNLYPTDISAVKAGDIFDYRVQESANSLLIPVNFRKKDLTVNRCEYHREDQSLYYINHIDTTKNNLYNYINFNIFIKKENV